MTSVSPQPPSIPPPAESAHSLPLPLKVSDESKGEQPFDWSSFVQAYAAGKWDPRCTPMPPRSHNFPGTVFNDVSRLEGLSTNPVLFRSVTSTSSDTVIPQKRVPGASSSSSLSSKLSLGTPGSGSDTGSSSTAASSVASVSYSPPAPVHSSTLSPSWPHMSLKMRREQNLRGSDLSSQNATPFQPLPKLTMPPPARGVLTRSLSDSSTAVSPAPAEDTSRLTTHESHHDFHAAAAAMRLAGDGVNVRPLALPSPEVELTDPLRGYTASITLPRSREGQDQSGDLTVSAITSPDSAIHSRKTRLSSFWNVLDDVTGSPIERSDPSPGIQNGHLSDLPAILASPVVTPSDSMVSSRRVCFKGPSLLQHNLPASAPLINPTKPLPADYFAMLPKERSSVPMEALKRQVGLGEEDKESVSSIPYLPVFDTSPEPLTSSSGGPPHPPLFNRTVSEPLALRTKPPEGSSIDPSSDLESLYPRPQSEIIKSSHRKIREEIEYLQRGYLIPPIPPNEWERQKALYKFVQLPFIIRIGFLS